VAELNGQGVTVDLPSGWDGRIFRRPQQGESTTAETADSGSPAPSGAATHAVVHLASVALPSTVGDFGSGAVERLGARDVFVVLFEYDPSSAGTKLFGRQGLPHALDASAFSTNVLQRRLRGQAGTQVFFTEAGRPFTLYVVLGSYDNRTELVPAVNRVLETIQVKPQ
jgi:hypothetical protein